MNCTNIGLPKYTGMDFSGIYLNFQKSIKIVKACVVHKCSKIHDINICNFLIDFYYSEKVSKNFSLKMANFRMRYKFIVLYVVKAILLSA